MRPDVVCRELVRFVVFRLPCACHLRLDIKLGGDDLGLGKFVILLVTRPMVMQSTPFGVEHRVVGSELDNCRWSVAWLMRYITGLHRQTSIFEKLPMPIAIVMHVVVVIPRHRMGRGRLIRIIPKLRITATLIVVVRVQINRNRL